MSKTVYIAYVSHSFELHTEIIGVYEKKYMAIRALFSYLVDNHYIFYNKNIDDNIQKEFEKYASEIMNKSTNIDMCLFNCVKQNNSCDIDWEYDIVTKQLETKCIDMAELRSDTIFKHDDLTI